MASDDDQYGQCQEKFILKRKLTGPPRLLLGKSKSMTQVGDRSEDRTKKRNQRGNINNGTQIHSTGKQSNMEAGEKESSHPLDISDILHATSKMDQDRSSFEQPFDPSSSEENQASKGQLEGRRKIGKSTGHGWKMIFSPALICVRRPRKYATAQDGEQVRTDRLTYTPAKSTREDTISLSDRCVDNVMKRRRGFNIHTWPTFKRLLTGSNVPRPRPGQGSVVQEVADDVLQQPAVTLRKRCQRLLMCGRKATPAALRLQSEDTQCPKNKEVRVELKRTQDHGPPSPGAFQGITLLGGPSDVRGPCSERVTVDAEVITLQLNDVGPTVTTTSQMSPLQRPAPATATRQVDTQTRPLSDTEETLVLKPETFTNTGMVSVLGVINVAMDANEIHVDELHDIHCLEKADVTQSARAIIDTVYSVAMDTNKYLSDSNPIISSENVAEENGGTLCGIAEDPFFQNGRPLAHTALYGSSVLQSNLCETNSDHRNDHEFGEGSGESSPLLCEETLLVETANTLVQAALSYAMEVLSVEQRCTPVVVHKEGQDCRDHA